jgi:hypothetical protein
MKSKEELKSEYISKNTKNWDEETKEKYIYEVEEDFRVWYEGYTQCQEDMTYILKKSIEYGYELRNNNKPINSGIDWVKEFNGLNKQD